MRRAAIKARALVAAVTVLLAIVCIAIWYLSRPGVTRSAQSQSHTESEAHRETATSSAEALPRPSVASTLNDLFERLRRNELPHAPLAARRAELLQEDSHAVLGAIREFLATGQDNATGAPFAIAPGGGDLATAPTFRVWLLDLAGAIDQTARTGEAAAISREVLATKRSPEEWAVALRNIAWAEPPAAPYLAAKFREMVSYDPWVTAPTAGLLEAFDIAVFSGDPALIPVFADLLRGSQPALRRAAGVALDRLAENAVLPVMTYLNTHPEILADRPMLRADYFAKADPAQFAQRAAVETYLARRDVSVAEKTKLVKALAAPGSFISDNLLTSPRGLTEDATRISGLDRALNEWLAANRFPELAPVLAQVRDRLQDR